MYAGELDSRAAGSYSEIRLGGGKSLFSSFKIVFWKFRGKQLPPPPEYAPGKLQFIFFLEILFTFYTIYVFYYCLLNSPLSPPPRFFFQYIFSPDIAWNDYRYSINFCWKCLKLNDLYGHYGYCWKEREANSQELTTRRTKGDERVKGQPLFWNPLKKVSSPPPSPWSS